MNYKLNHTYFLIFSITFFNVVVCFSQATTRPSFSINGNPANDGICVSPEVPNREAFALANRIFPVGTEFILEVSEEDGSFDTDPTILASFVTNQELNASNNRNINFQSFPIPENLRGDNYAIRLRYILPNQSIQTGNTRTDLYIYYYNSDEEIVLSGPNPNSRIVALCEGETTTLTVTPSNFPEYEWTFNGNIITGVTGPVLEDVVQPGTYRVKAVFGFCNNFFNDDESEVTVVNFTPTTVNILQGPVIDFCPSDVKILECSINASGLIYEWYKDGVLLENENSGTIRLPQSNFAGIYTVTVIGTDTCFISTNQVQVNNLGSDILSQPPENIVLLPNQPSILLQVTTNAPDGSTAQWFRNGVEATPVLPINDPSALQFEVVTNGIYRIDIVANDACGDTLQAETNVTSAASLFLTIDNVISCEDSAGTAAITEFVGITVSGEEIPITEDQLEFFNFQWFRNGQSLINETDTSINLSAEDLNQTFFLEASIIGGGFQPVISNSIIIEFVNNLTIEASSIILPPGGTVTLTVPQILGFEYTWFFNGEIIEGETLSQIEVSENGTYFVRLSNNDECEINSDPIIIGEDAGPSEIIPNVVTFNGSQYSNWRLPQSLLNDPAVEVTIFDSRGVEDLKTTNYQNNWPAENSRTQGQGGIYYYIITKNSAVVRKGSITVMR